MPHVIVWDLETVPDIAGYAAANSLAGKSDEEIREALGNKFEVLPPWLECASSNKIIFLIEYSSRG
jgi:hypothetical protein